MMLYDLSRGDCSCVLEVAALKYDRRRVSISYRGIGLRTPKSVSLRCFLIGGTCQWHPRISILRLRVHVENLATDLCTSFVICAQKNLFPIISCMHHLPGCLSIGQWCFACGMRCLAYTSTTFCWQPLSFDVRTKIRSSQRVPRISSQPGLQPCGNTRLSSGTQWASV